MDNQPITETAKFSSGGQTLSAELFQPASKHNGGVVVIAHGSDGMTDPWAVMIRDYATELAKLNFLVLIPDYLGKTGTEPGRAVFDLIPKHLGTWHTAFADAVKHATTLPGVVASRVGLLGFSLGGHLCLRSRASARVVVEFFAPEFGELGGIGPASVLTPKAQIHHGLVDPLVPFTNAENIHNKLKREGTAAELFRYEGAGHGFAGADANNATARRSAKERTLEFIGANL